MPTDHRLIEDYIIPIEAVSAEARREESIRKGHISTQISQVFFNLATRQFGTRQPS
jgi:adenine-specific DNA methylase